MVLGFRVPGFRFRGNITGNVQEVLFRLWGFLLWFAGQGSKEFTRKRKPQILHAVVIPDHEVSTLNPQPYTLCPSSFDSSGAGMEKKNKSLFAEPEMVVSMYRNIPI